MLFEQQYSPLPGLPLQQVGENVGPLNLPCSLDMPESFGSSPQGNQTLVTFVLALHLLLLLEQRLSMNIRCVVGEVPGKSNMRKQLRLALLGITLPEQGGQFSHQFRPQKQCIPQLSGKDDPIVYLDHV